MSGNEGKQPLRCLQALLCRKEKEPTTGGAQISDKGDFWNRMSICRKTGVYENFWLRSFVQKAVTI